VTNDEDIPPAAVCASCGRPDCEGACTLLRPAVRQELPWEREAALASLWQTCRYLAQPPRRWLLAVHRGRLMHAFGFAILTEVGAVASYVLPTLAIAAAALEAFGLPPGLLGSVWGWLGACGALGGLMVLLHVLWAVLVEVGLLYAGAVPWWRKGLLLACYSCGWDLLTSPLGVLLGSLTGGKVLTLLRAALANPRAASAEYLVRLRGRSPRSAATLAGGAAVVSIACGCLLSLVALVQVAPEMWTLFLGVW